MIGHRVGWIVAALAAMPCTASGRDADASVETRLPRAFGYFVGDVLDYRATIAPPPGYALDGASLPQAGALDYWLDLVAVDVAQDDGTTTLNLRYQVFYVPMEPSERVLPPQRLRFLPGAADGGAAVEAILPAFTFVMSPLRPIMQRSRPEAMQPDVLSFAIDTRRRQWQAAGGWSLFAAGLLSLLAYRGIGPFARRPARPFRQAEQRLRRLARQAGADSYGQSLAVLHRALDAAHGRRLLADDLDAFEARAPRYRSARPELERFFAASRLFHFAEQPDAAVGLLPPVDILPMARRLSALERAP